MSPDGTKIYVADKGNQENTFQIIDAATNKVTGDILVGINPWG